MGEPHTNLGSERSLWGKQDLSEWGLKLESVRQFMAQARNYYKKNLATLNNATKLKQY
ncbi:MAG: hypothetical protein AAF974_11130 [Cyanobacteria bacterium P01_E01_bin.34]